MDSDFGQCRDHCCGSPSRMNNGVGTIRPASGEGKILLMGVHFLRNWIGYCVKEGALWERWLWAAIFLFLMQKHHSGRYLKFAFARCCFWRCAIWVQSLRCSKGKQRNVLILYGGYCVLVWREIGMALVWALSKCRSSPKVGAKIKSNVNSF